MTRNHPLTGARCCEEAFVRKELPRAKWIEGIPFVMSGRTCLGMDATFFVTVEASLSQIDRAVVEAKQKYNITTSTVLLIPRNWIERRQVPRKKRTYPQV